MSSGIKVPKEMTEAFDAMKTSKKGSSKADKTKYMMYKLDSKYTKLEEDKIVTRAEAEPESSEAERYKNFIESLPANEARFIFYDFDFIAQNDATNSKIINILWAPSGAPIKSKMVSASTWSTIKTSLTVSTDTLEGQEASDLSESEVLEKLKAKASN